MGFSYALLLFVRTALGEELVRWDLDWAIDVFACKFDSDIMNNFGMDNTQTLRKLMHNMHECELYERKTTALAKLLQGVRGWWYSHMPHDGGPDPTTVWLG